MKTASFPHTLYKGKRSRGKQQPHECWI